MEESKQINQVIDVLMLAGTLLIESGSEIHRVEDTMIRIAHSQGIVDCNVLAMPVAIFFSIENANVTRMKRILRTNYNIEKVCDVNQISRQLVSGEIDLEQAYQALSELKSKRVPYTNLQLTIAATLSAPFFSIMFGGNFYDAIGRVLRLSLPLLFLLSLRNTFAFLLPLPLRPPLSLVFWPISGRAIVVFLPIPISLSQAVSCPSFLESL